MRSFKTAFTEPMLKTYQAGVMAYRYKGVPCLKSPVDIGIYMRLLWDLQPKTFFEIGSRSGGSALLFADILGNMGCGGVPVISIDIKLPEGVEDSRIRFLQGDVLALGPLFAAEGFDTLPHPWFAIDDSAHTHDSCTAALEHFAARMVPGDMLVIEDGVLADLGWSERFKGGPNSAIAAYMSAHPGVFEIVEDYCDMYGPNATYNPNGYLRKL